jgi:hypothetical protein
MTAADETAWKEAVNEMIGWRVEEWTPTSGVFEGA